MRKVDAPCGSPRNRHCGRPRWQVLVPLVLGLGSLLASCAMPVRRSLELGVHVGDTLRTEAPATLRDCLAWHASSPLSTREQAVPCLAATLPTHPAVGIGVPAGTTVKVVRLQALGLVDAASTQVFVTVPGHGGTHLVTPGDMAKLFPNRHRHAD